MPEFNAETPGRGDAEKRQKQASLASLYIQIDFMALCLSVSVLDSGIKLNQLSQARKSSITRNISLFFFSNKAKMKMIVAPVTMPATHQIHVQPKFDEA